MLDVTEQLRRYGDAATRHATLVGTAKPSMPTTHARGPRRRRRSLAGITAFGLVILVVVGLLVVERGGNKTEVALNPRVAVPQVEWTQIATPPGAQGVQNVAGNRSGLVAIGAVPTTVDGNRAPEPDVATIWFSSDIGQ